MKRRLNTLPNNILETIHTTVARNNINSSKALSKASKRFRTMEPKNRNNKVPFTIPFTFPKTHSLPGEEDVVAFRHVMQCYATLLKTLKEDLRTKELTYDMGRRRYYAFVKRRALMIFDSSDMNTKNISFRFSSRNTSRPMSRVRSVNNSNSNTNNEYVHREIHIRVKVPGTRSPFFMDLILHPRSTINMMITILVTYGTAAVEFTASHHTAGLLIHPHLKNMQMQNMNVHIMHPEMYDSVHTMTKRHAIDLYRLVYLIKRVWARVYRITLRTVWINPVVRRRTALEVVENILKPLNVTVYEEGMRMARAPSARMANSNTNANA